MKVDKDRLRTCRKDVRIVMIYLCSKHDKSPSPKSQPKSRPKHRKHTSVSERRQTSSGAEKLIIYDTGFAQSTISLWIALAW